MSLLQDLFVTNVNMSITASYVAIGVILVRLLLKRVPKVFSYVLWLPVLFRLVCPFSFDSAFSFFNLINLNTRQGSGITEGLLQTPVIQSGIDSIDSAVNASLPQAIPAASVSPMEIWMNVLSLVWIFGVIVLLIYKLKKSFRLRLAWRAISLRPMPSAQPSYAALSARKSMCLQILEMPTCPTYWNTSVHISAGRII